MNARIARKIAKQSQWFEDPEDIWGAGRIRKAKLRAQRADPKHRIFKSSLALVRLLEHGKHEEARQHWRQLRERIIKHWSGPVIRADHQWASFLSAERLTPAYAQDSIWHYSDRWCGWRVALIDLALEGAE